MSENEKRSLFDLQSFSSWLRRWRDAENLEWTQLAKDAGLHPSAVAVFARGKPSSRPPARGYDPSVTTMYRLATALDLDLGYLLEQAGMPHTGSRMSALTRAERMALHQALAAANTELMTDATKEILRRLMEEIEVTLPTNKERP